MGHCTSEVARLLGLTWPEPSFQGIRGSFYLVHGLRRTVEH